MKNSYFLPIQSNKELIQVRVFDYKRGYTFELMIGDKHKPIFDRCSLSEDREFIVYVGEDCKKYLSEEFDDFVKVELKDKGALETVIKALKIRFPNAPLFVAIPKQDKRRFEMKFPTVEFIPDFECFRN